MKNKLAFLLLFLALFAGVIYWYTKPSVCEVGVTYRLGNIDERFHLSEESVLSAIDAAAFVWEDATNLDIFSYDPDGDLVVNFIFDERQQFTQEESQNRGVLNDQESDINSSLKQLEDLEDSIQTKERSYEGLLRSYRTKESEYKQLESDPTSNGARISSLAREINTLVEQIDQAQDDLNIDIGKYNLLIQEVGETANRYNTSVDTYNDSYTGEYEFDQGDHVPGEINIYQYDSRGDLILVLAHELGHELHIGHVEDPQAVMYHLLNQQSTSPVITRDADLAGLAKHCRFIKQF